jgi:hypothetical protein
MYLRSTKMVCRQTNATQEMNYFPVSPWQFFTTLLLLPLPPPCWSVHSAHTDTSVVVVWFLLGSVMIGMVWIVAWEKMWMKECASARATLLPPSHCPHQVKPPTRTPAAKYHESPLVTKASRKRSLDTTFRFSKDNEDTINDSSCVSASGTNCGLWIVDCGLWIVVVEDWPTLAWNNQVNNQVNAVNPCRR